MASNKWQPIETAPKDSTVLLYLPSVRNVVSGYWSYHSDRWIDCWCLGLEHAYEPTHWMPRPELPTEDD